MYDFYPSDQPYHPDPRHEAPFAIVASAAELQKWGLELDFYEERDRRETMTADRVVAAPETVMYETDFNVAEALHRAHNRTKQ